MNSKIALSLFSILVLTSFIIPRDWQWKILEKVTDAHLRGLCVVDDEIVWASGVNGTFLRTEDGGETWETDTIKGATHLDFRDIHAFDKKTALVLSAGEKDTRIYKTTDAGKTWKLTYENKEKGVFFDGFDFADTQRGIAFSDPVENYLYLIQTKDGGETWQQIPKEKLPPTIKGEAGYAASGTGIIYDENNIWIATGGGEKARIFHSNDDAKTWNVYDTPMVSGEGKGIFSMTMIDHEKGVIVGGSYIDSLNMTANCAITEDGGKTWKILETQQPKGYRSCVAKHPKKELLFAVGRSGIDYSKDQGKTWKVFSEEGYYACGMSKKYLYAVGRKGKMGKMRLF